MFMRAYKIQNNKNEYERKIILRFNTRCLTDAALASPPYTFVVAYNKITKFTRIQIFTIKFIDFYFLLLSGRILNTFYEVFRLADNIEKPCHCLSFPLSSINYANASVALKKIQN